jgi:hypothetical protein
MTNRKQHSATGNAGDATNSQEQAHALYTAHQVHTLANWIYRRMTLGTGSGNGAQQGQTGDAAYGSHGNSPTFGAMQGGTMNQTFPFDFASHGANNPFFGMPSFGFAPYGVGATQANPYFATQNFNAGQNPFGFTGYGNAFGYNPYGFMPHWMFAGNAALPSPFGFMPQWGMHAGNTMHDPSACMTPRNANFSPAPALFYWYP